MTVEVLPIAAEANSVAALVPIHVFIQLISAQDAVLGDVVVIAYRQPKSTDARPIQVEAVERVAAFRSVRRAQLVAVVREGITKFIHKRRLENAGHAQVGLIRVIATRSPGGFQIAPSGEIRVDVRTVTEVGVVFVVKLVIQPGVEQFAAEWQVPDVTEARKDRIGKADRLSAYLLCVLIVGEEDKAILFDRDAKLTPPTRPREERVILPFEQVGGLRRIGAKRIVQSRIARSSQSRISRNVVIAIESEPAAMKLIAACARDDVNRSHSGIPD